MESPNNELMEINGRWYFRGISLKIGDRVMVDGITWKVIRFGWSHHTQIPFLWIQNDRVGITVYCPSQAQGVPPLPLRPIERTLSPQAAV